MGGSHSVTCHLALVTFLPLQLPKLVLDLATPKAELTWEIYVDSHFQMMVVSSTYMCIQSATCWNSLVMEISKFDIIC